MRKFLTTALMFLLLYAQVSAQVKIITGKITDAKNSTPLAGVTIHADKTDIYEQSGPDGTFSIRIPVTVNKLIFTSVGYAQTEIIIGQRTSLNVVLSTEEKGLSEVIVVAYGVQKKADVTGAISVVKATDIENKPFTSVDKALQGAVAGLQSVAGSGQPGSIQFLRLRGIGSITASSAPLFVIDGVPINTGDISRGTTTANSLSTLNPNDVEEITVLKDASATSIYGARAANGVILVTTKKGRAGKTRFRLDVEIGQHDIPAPKNEFKILNADEFFMLTREGLINAGNTPAQADAALNNLGFGSGINTDWYDLVTRKGNQAQYNLSASGGNDKTTFYLSGGYFKQEGVVIASDFQRYSGDIKLTHTVSDKFNFNVGLNIGYGEQVGPTNGGTFANPVLTAYLLQPSRAPYRADGSFNISATEFPTAYNPLAIAEMDKSKLKILSTRGSIGGEYKILRNLSFNSRVGVDYNLLEEDIYNNPIHGDGRPSNGRAFSIYTRIFNWVWTNIANYRQKLTDEDFYVDLKAGYESQLSKSFNSNLQSQGFPPIPELIYASAGSTPVQAQAFISDYAFTSGFSLATVNYHDKYVLSGSFRRDGSSRFGINNQYGNFWSIGGSWNIDQENFMRNISFINQLKLRASYGANGNAGIGNYDWRALFNYGAAYNGQSGGAHTTIGNNDLTWELNKPLDVGLDIGILNNRFNLSIDYYKRKTDQLLLNDPLSRTTGFASKLRNIGGLENSGIEITIDATPIRSKDFSWNLTANFAYNKNRITALVNNRDIPAAPFIRRVGEDFQSFFMWQWAGVNPENGDPLWYADSTKNTTTNIVSRAQQVIVGSASPKFFGGFNNTFRYKGITLEAQFYYNFGNYVTDNWSFLHLGDGANGHINRFKKQLNRWQKPGDITDVPKFVLAAGGNRNSSSPSTRYLYKGDYIRLRNLQLGYELPKSVISRVHISSLNVYVRGTNLWTWVKDDNMPFDPEAGITSTTNLEVYIPRTLTVGINVGF